MTNEEKARNIVSVIFERSDNVSFYEMSVKSALEAMHWKDEQFLQWLKENLAKETFTMFTSKSQGVINFEPVIKAFEELNKQ